MTKIFSAAFVSHPRAASSPASRLRFDWRSSRPPWPPTRKPLVSPAWLNAHLRDAESGGARHPLGHRRQQPETFAQGHIPGAVHSDYDKAGWRVTRNNVPFMVPTTPELEKLIGDLGIDETSHVVVVPAGVNVLDFGSAARTYWTLKYAGVRDVSILDGGLAAWKAAGFALDKGAHAPSPAIFTATHRQQHSGACLRRRDHRAQRRRHADRRASGVVLPRQGEGARGAGLWPHSRRGRCRQRAVLRSGDQPAEAEGGACGHRRRVAGGRGG